MNNFVAPPYQMLGGTFYVTLATPDDAVDIGFIHSSSWKTTYAGIVHPSFLDAIDLNERIAGAEKRIANPASDCLVLVARDSKQIVGFADVGPCREKNVDSDGELYAIYLLKEFQGNGGGKLLLDACISAARERGYLKMMVSVLTQNISSCKFYEAMGAKYIGFDHVDIEEHRYPTSTYIWRL